MEVIYMEMRMWKIKKEKRKKINMKMENKLLNYRVLIHLKEL